MINWLQKFPRNALQLLKGVPGAVAKLQQHIDGATFNSSDDDPNSPAAAIPDLSTQPTSSCQSVVADFCNCRGKCNPKSVGLERRCCRRLDGNCVTTWDDVSAIVLHREAIRTAVNANRSQLYEDMWEHTNKSMRHQAYCQFVYYTCGNTGYKKRMVLPSCVTWAIQQMWPSEDGNYTGFKCAMGSGSKVLAWTIDDGVQEVNVRKPKL